MDEHKMPLMPDNDKAEDGRQTLGELMRLFREGHGTVEEYAAKIGISPEYLAEIENGVRYAPTGKVWRKLVEVYCAYDPDGSHENAFLERGGYNRIEVNPKLEEFLRRNFYARILVEHLMQIDCNPIIDGYEDIAIEIDEGIKKLAKARGVKLKPIAPDPEEDGYAEKLQEYIAALKDVDDDPK